MRELKFRAWDTVHREIIEWQEFKKIHASIGYINECEETDARVLMQYTGLKDKNGKEVYEGDIVKCSSGCAHIMKWYQEVASTGLGGMPGFYLSGLDEGYAWMGIEEVIGNKFENPDLLSTIIN